MIEVARRNSTVEVISQKIHPVDRDKKHQLLTHLIREHNWFQVLVFTRTKHGANKLAEQLSKADIPALAIHGNKSQAARTRALAEFKSADLQVLVATDIAARGIDIDQLPYVVNYDLPNVPEDYVHRIGRTGRAGATGQAVSLVCVDERNLLRDIERFIKREVPVEIVEGFEPDPNARPQPIQLRSQEHRSPPRHQQGKRSSATSGRSSGKGGNTASRNGAQRSSQGTASAPRTQNAVSTTTAAARPQRPPGVRTSAMLGQPAANSAAGKRRSGQR
jgi:ATP-dependent RNA helicase RhlE